MSVNYSEPVEYRPDKPAKSEDCPNCGEAKRFHYDAQACAECSYPNHEPDFLCQNGDLTGSAEQQAWFRKHIDRIKDEGATFVRMSQHPESPNLVLLEGWKVQPHNLGDPRWQFFLADVTTHG